MTWWQRTPVFYKILGVFLVALAISASFDIYLVASLNTSKSLIAELGGQYSILNDLSTLARTNDTLSDAVKSYVITRDAQWQTAYDDASSELETQFTDLSTEPYLTSSDETTILGLKDVIDRREAVEQAVITDVASGDAIDTSQLFDASYATEQANITQLIDVLIQNRTQEVAMLIDQNDATLGMLRTVINILFIFFVVIFIFLWRSLAQGLVQPIEKLTQAVKKFGASSLRELGSNPIVPVPEGVDEIGQLAKAFRDMTERIQRDQARFLASVNGLPFGFIMFDAREEPVVMNQIAKKVFPEDDVSLAAVAKKFALEEKLVGAAKNVFEHAADETIPEAKIENDVYRLVMEPITTSPQNQVIGAVLIFENITEQKRLEQSKDAFLSIASHEMRTPLAVIRGNAELLLEDPAVTDNGNVKPLVDSIVKGSVRMLSIVDDFLDIQRLEENRIALKVEPVDIVAALDETVVDLSKLAAEKKLTIVFDKTAVTGVPPLPLDKYRLQQIFINLISNSIHYTETGTITIWIERRDAGVSVFFKDTGIGIAAEDQGRLFRRFETGKTFIRSKEYGSGMGLYISRLLARLMGGDLWLVSSEFGSGSTFCLMIPFAKPPAA